MQFVTSWRLAAGVEAHSSDAAAQTFDRLGT